jgi:hypothetical protein
VGDDKAGIDAEDGAGDWVRASEVGEYAYCARAYWLHRVVGAGEPQDDAHAELLASGAIAHEDYGRTTLRGGLRRRRALTVIGIALLIAAVLLAVSALRGWGPVTRPWP